MIAFIIDIFCFVLMAGIGFVMSRLFYIGVKEEDAADIMTGLTCGLIAIISSVVFLSMAINSVHVCPKCKHFSFDEKYCTECGQQLMCEEQKCPKCNEVADNNATYCYNCGEKLGGQHK